MKKIFFVLIISLLLIDCDSGYYGQNVNQLRVHLNSLNSKDIEGNKFIFYEGKRFSGTAFSEFENGQLKHEVNYKNGVLDGLAKSWYENGKLKLEQNYKDDVQEGFSRLYYENGQLHKEMNYKDGKENGLFRGCNKNGQLHAESKYKDGKIVSNKIWDKNGKEINLHVDPNK